MLSIIILCFQVAFGNPISPNCCPSKTVGDFSYTLVETEAPVPSECFNCTYTRDDMQGSLFCFAPGDLPVHCDKEKPVNIAYPDKFMPLYELNFKEEAPSSSSENTNQTVSSFKEGWGTKWSACASATKGVVATVFIDTVITAVSDDLVKNDVETIAQYLKSEYQLKFKEEIEKASFKTNVGWSWLGISASGERSNTNVEKYENGQSGLDEARETFSQLLSTHINTESRLRAEGKLIGDSRIPSELCLFFKTENVKFADNTSTRIISVEGDNLKAANSNGKPVKTDGIPTADMVDL